MTGADAAASDPSRLVAAFRSLPAQLERAFGEVLAAEVRLSGTPANVAFCGMGGSAAAGDVAAAATDAPVPVATWRDYAVPPYCDERSGIVVLTYSGTTDEALSAYDDARVRRASVVAVCSGGTLAERARRDGVPLALVPADAPMPRAALGYLSGAALAVLRGGEASGDVAEAARTLTGLAGELDPGAGGSDARDVAEWLGDALPVVWGAGPVGAAAAWRWKCAFNENAKVPAFASALPELNHHEVVGWGEATGRTFRLLVLRHGYEHPTTEARLRATLDEVGSALEWREVRARGASRLSQVLSLMLVGDVASSLHAIARGIDPAPIEAIERVKARLARTG